MNFHGKTKSAVSVILTIGILIILMFSFIVFTYLLISGDKGIKLFVGSKKDRIDILNEELDQ